jgi:hypothetical protein
VILDVLGWLAAADAVAAALLAGLIYAIGKRSGTGVSVWRAVGLAVLLGSPAAVLFLVVWLLWQIE